MKTKFIKKLNILSLFSILLTGLYSMEQFDMENFNETQLHAIKNFDMGDFNENEQFAVKIIYKMLSSKDYNKNSEEKEQSYSARNITLEQEELPLESINQVNPRKRFISTNNNKENNDKNKTRKKTITVGNTDNIRRPKSRHNKFYQQLADCDIVLANSFFKEASGNFTSIQRSVNDRLKKVIREGKIRITLNQQEENVKSFFKTLMLLLIKQSKTSSCFDILLEGFNSIGIDVNFKYEDGNTLLHKLALTKYRSRENAKCLIIEKFLDFGVNAWTTNNDGLNFFEILDEKTQTILLEARKNRSCRKALSEEAENALNTMREKYNFI